MRYTYDTMGRPITLTSTDQNPPWVSNVQYGLSGELLTLNNETRKYNSRLHLTNLVGGTINMEYRYSATQNNGQITQQKDWITGEEVTYTYDTLQRLIGAVTTDPSSGQSFTYDGFGNRTSATVTKGSAPYGTWSYDSNNHLLNNGGWDANGNMTGYGSYDVENRLVSVPANPANELYAYAPGNKRIWKRKPDATEELYFYGISGQKLATYNISANLGGVQIATLDTNLYFGSRTIVSRGVPVLLDRLGSNRQGGAVVRYFPYGEEYNPTTAQDRDKFATYYRDSTTALDYAQNRYYASTLGRFLSPDPSNLNLDLGDPSSWNAYSYTEGDPINYNDPLGLLSCGASEIWIQGQGFKTVSSLFTTSNDLGLLADFIFGESGPGSSSSGAPLGSQNYWDEKLTIGEVAINRYLIVNGILQIINESTGQPMTIKGWGKADGTLASILGANNVNKKGKDVYQFDVFRIVNGSIQLSSGVQARLQEGLNSDASTATCENLIDSAFAAWAVYQTWKTMPNFSGFGITTANDALFLPTSFNSFGHKSHRFETLIPGTDYGTANRFYGVQEGLFRRTPAP